MKFSELLGKDKSELHQMCFDLKREYMNLRILSKTTQDVKTSTIRVCKKNIARIKTRLSQLRLNKGE
jgi:ribosomal protein L29